jgi:hypothetical protein
MRAWTLVPQHDEKAIKKAVATHANELGGPVGAAEITLEFLDGQAAPGCILFHARWGAGQREGILSGLLRDAEAPDTYPAQALGKVFQRWIEAEGTFPTAVRAAEVVAYVLDPLDRCVLVRSDEDKAKYIDRQEWLPFIAPPEAIEVAGRPGVTFWWFGPSGTSRMRVYLADGGRAGWDETSIQTLIASKR